ncbi:MAG TPA: hypothetical protein VF596_18820 [Pyrinomonadaceae bacterium]|jgi:hypothetical protein
MVWQSGTSFGRVGGNAVSVGMDGSIGVAGFGGNTKNQSVLASRLQPPTQPDASGSTLVFGSFSLIVWLVLTIASAYVFGMESTLSVVIGQIVLIAFSVGMFIFLTKYSAADFKGKMTIYQKEAELWAKSWICHRCGNTWFKK